MSDELQFFTFEEGDLKGEPPVQPDHTPNSAEDSTEEIFCAEDFQKLGLPDDKAAILARVVSKLVDTTLKDAFVCTISEVAENLLAISRAETPFEEGSPEKEGWDVACGVMSAALMEILQSHEELWKSEDNRNKE